MCDPKDGSAPAGTSSLEKAAADMCDPALGAAMTKLMDAVGQLNASTATGQPPPAAIRQMLEVGLDDGDVADLVLFERHPEIKAKIDPANKELVAEWTSIRDKVVRPILRQLQEEKIQCRSGGRGGGGAFLLDTERSYLSKIPGGQEYLDFKWHRLDFPKTKEAVGSASEASLAKLRADPDLVLFRNPKKGNAWYIKGAHQAKAEQMLVLLATHVPERRANDGDTAVLTKAQFEKHEAAYDKYIAGELLTVKGQRDRKLNQFACGAFQTMQEAAVKDGVVLVIGNSFRSRKTAKANAENADNSDAVAEFSTHCLGLAVDLNLHVKATLGQWVEQSTRMERMINMYKSPSYKWMAEHGREYGWYAYRKEPWHWEYNPPGFRAKFWATAEKSIRLT